MANILRGYGLAREQGFFKQEQEADVQRHRQRLIKEGKLPEEASAKPASEEEKEAAAMAAFETLPEVLQQASRIHDPDALRRRQFDRRA